MWQMRYWAVLGFMALLAIVILIFSLLLLAPSNLLGGPRRRCSSSAVGGYLFCKLVRVLSRIQMPQAPRRRLKRHCRP